MRQQAFVPHAVLGWTSRAKSANERSSSTAAIVCRHDTYNRLIAVGIATAASIAVAFAHPARAAIMTPECINGEGPGCDASAAEAPIIKELLERSRQNHEKHDKARLEKYWEDGYKSYFSFGYDKELKRNEDGTYSLERAESITEKTLRSLGVDLPHPGGVN